MRLDDVVDDAVTVDDIDGLCVVVTVGLALPDDVGHDVEDTVTVPDLDIVEVPEDDIDALSDAVPLTLDVALPVVVELPVEEDVPHALVVEERDIMLLAETILEALELGEAPQSPPFTVSQNWDMQSLLAAQERPLSTASRRNAPVTWTSEPIAVFPTAWRVGIMYRVSKNSFKINFIINRMKKIIQHLRVSQIVIGRRVHRGSRT